MHIIVIAIAYYIYIPVFYDLEVTSIYEYFKIRYNNKIRVFASIMYIIHMILLLPIIIYVPALAFSQGKILTRVGIVLSVQINCFSIRRLCSLFNTISV